MHHAHDSWWWGGPLHPIVIVLFLALLVAGTVWLMRRRFPGVSAAPAVSPATPTAVIASDPTVAALRMRYASGDVSREEFHHAMEDLAGGAAPSSSRGTDGDDTAPTVS